MNILLTGATGYIAQRLLPVLAEAGHRVICCVRDARRFHYNGPHAEQVSVVEADFLNEASLAAIPEAIDLAYYLIHSMSTSSGNFSDLEARSARHFVQRIEQTQARQIIFLSGIVNDSHLSPHLRSRKHVEELLGARRVPLTTLRAGIIIGSGSASFEIIRDLVEKLPVMVAPSWLNTRCQPIGVRNVVQYLAGVALVPETFHRSFDIGGPDILSFKDMLLQFAAVRGLKRHIYTVPVMTPRLSSYWLYFLTSTNYNLASNLVDSMKVEVVCQPSEIKRLVPLRLLSYKEAVALAFDKIDQNLVLSSWSDALADAAHMGGPDAYVAVRMAAYMAVPRQGCFIDVRKVSVADPGLALDNVFCIGGKRGWYYADFLWNIRGWIDKVFGGAGLNRGRKNSAELHAGQSLDFWRVIVADRAKQRLLLYAEMKVPGEAWLEFKIEGHTLIQTATFRPLGLWGRVYWYLMLPFHHFIFSGMARRISTRPPDLPR